VLDVDGLRAGFMPERIRQRKRTGGNREVDDREHDGDQAH
jgi:hypothetical protein